VIPEPRPRGLIGCPRCGASPRPLLFELHGNRNAATLAFLALLCLVPGVLLPFVTSTQLGTEKAVSLVGGIVAMLGQGELLVGIVLLVFSLVFPFAKLVFLLIATSSLLPVPKPLRHRLHDIAAATGKYSLLDVLVVAILIVAIKMRGVAEIRIASGTVLFCVAIFLSILSGLLVSFEHLEENE